MAEDTYYVPAAILAAALIENREVTTPKGAAKLFLQTLHAIEMLPHRSNGFLEVAALPEE